MSATEILGQSGWEQRRHEIPASFLHRPHKYEEAVYGQLTKVSVVGSVLQSYSNETYRMVLSALATQTYPSRLVFHSVIVQFVQYEELYDYYSVTNGFQDKYSLRSDHSPYSNISGGTGLFGAYSVDSLVHVLPYDFIYNRR